MGSMTEETDLLFVAAEEEGARIDKFLAERFPTHSRTYFQNLIEEGCVLLNGELVKKRIALEEGDEISVCFQAIPGPSLEPESIPLDILFEDEHLLVINKPPGMVVHPAPGNWSGTFVNALLAHCHGKAPGDDPIRPGIVHRLDKDTSGVLIAAKTLVAHQKLIEQFSMRQVEKLYLAICLGRPANGTVRAPIGRHPVHRKEMAVLSDGREAISEMHLAAFNEQLSLVLIRPLTGRTHQIRVHLKHIGCPVLGDHVYGNEKQNALLHPARQLLHAYRLGITHPVTAEPLKFSAPLPEDLKIWIQRLCGPSLCTHALSS
ncbi:MAG: RluA family pseudouridine synthase [Chlamydiia bacterium]|nr:RluA family pseudouridine synthase [Chlamydiia bacterium]